MRLLPPHDPADHCACRPIVRHPAVVTDPEDACPLAVGEGPGLLERLAILPALRARRGRRHTLASVLALSAAAVLAGGRSVAGIAEWAADAPGSVLPALGVSCEPCRPNLGCACLALPRLMTHCGEPYPTRANTAAMPIPPPMQSVTSP
jgi:DDE_Tnp_1-associated